MLEGFLHRVFGDLERKHPVTEVLVPRSVAEHLDLLVKSPHIVPERLQRVALSWALFLEAGVERGTFREDFYYRLWWAVLDVPPLRERREDIALLVEHFRSEVNQVPQLALGIKGVSRDAMAMLERDDWPGNVRELEAVVKRAMVRRRRGWVTPADIVLPRLRRDRLPEGASELGIRLTPVQEQALRLAAIWGEVRRRNLVERCGISPEAARRALLGLERVGVLRRDGSGRGARYLPVVTHIAIDRTASGT